MKAKLKLYRVFILVALLSGARNEKNVHLSKKTYNRMKELFPKSTDELVSAAVLLANVYAASGQIEESSNVRKELDRPGIKKQVGLSWTVTNGQIFVRFPL